MDWYYQADTSEVLCVTDVTDSSNPRYYYISAGSAFDLPEPYYVGGFYNNSPVATWYYAGSANIIKDRTKLYKDCSIELRWRQPTRWETQLRRMRKKLLN